MSKKKIVRTVTHDRLAILRNFDNGQFIRFSIGRSGENLNVGLNDPEAAKTLLKELDIFVKFRNDETNIDRIDRLENIFALELPALIDFLTNKKN